MLLLNLRRYHRPDGVLPFEPPFVSLLVPARNEARGVERCVRSLLAQDYPAFEVIVLDDHSEDETGAIVRSVANRQLSILEGKALPDGWTGKNWACHQLAQAASSHSQWLLFTDADTEHVPDTLRRTVAEAARDGLALLSLMPEQEVRSWAEVLTVPLLPLQILGFLPLPVMEDHPNPDAAAANGQFMLFQRAAYERIGGHATHAGQIIEDVLLARLVKRHGARVRLANGVGLVRCRMYHDVDEVVGGFRRSFASGFHESPWLAVGLLTTNFAALLWPFLRAPWSRPARGLALGVLALRLLLGRHTAAPVRSVLGHPLGMALLLWAQVLAAWDAWVRGETGWKGRRYHVKGQKSKSEGQK